MSYGLLVDLRAIQDYIFSSNRLRDNIGASYLVSHFFDDIQVQKKVIGGGNMFCVVDTEDEAKNVISGLSKKAITMTPGLRFSAIYMEMQQSQNNILQPFWDELQKEKQKRNQISVVPSFGINAQCSASSYAAEYNSKDGLISAVIKAKRDTAEKANIEINETYDKYLEGYFVFPEDFAHLGTIKGEESNIAVVHIDGNDMGQLFAECTDLNSYKKLSEHVNEVNMYAFSVMIDYAVKKILYGDWNHYIDRLRKRGKKIYLPIRPIFIGGDDVTFVCEGRLGIELAIKFIELVDNFSKNEFSCCAGVAVVNEKYPFYQSQQMAQSLCRQAKNKRKSQNSKGAYVDFQLISSSTCDPIEETRKQYVVDEKKLYQKPYTLEKLQEQIDNANQLKKWPRSKVKEMRDVLFKGEEAIKAFDMQIKARGDLVYPNVSPYNDFDSSYAFYPDMIELMDLIPYGGKK